ncbi:FAM50 family protein [Lachnellula subtilissima]|uniref:FAM50 family protein n=1 Tax=Lachnellula subtilissima TaxID=602034 RepID=A0A8H8RF55_9HELO|nr:FAM50 family protein [Lachnellula subtilissima]
MRALHHRKKTAEDLLSTQTVGLVNLSDFRKRRAEALEQKERDAQDLLTGTGTSSGTASGRATPDGASTPMEPPVKKKKRKVGTPKLSFGMDEEEDGGESTDAATPLSGSASPRSGTPLSAKDSAAKKKGVNSNVALAPRLLTKSALLKEAQTRESLRKEFLVLQEAVKATEINIPEIMHGYFLDRSRKVGADLGVGEKVNSRREWARIGVDDLMMVRGNIIIPHHYDFYYFVINHTLGPGNRLLFDYSSEPPRKSTTPSSEINLDTYNPLSGPSKTKAKDVPTDKKDLEGTADDPTYTKVVDRRWYERNKHIFPASVWQEFDPEKDYQKEVKRDAGGNAFFFS